MLYRITNGGATAARPRVVDTRGLLHKRGSKSAKACDAADAVDGLTILRNPTLRLAAAAYGVSVGSVARALRLTPEQRQAVRQNARPLVLPRMSSPPAPENVTGVKLATIARLAPDRLWHAESRVAPE